MSQPKRIVAMVIGALFATGCATLMPEHLQTVQLSSTPPEASVRVDGMVQEAMTPLTLSLDPRRSHELLVEKGCYASKTVLLHTELAKRQMFLTVYDLVNQLPPTIHVDLAPICQVKGNQEKGS